MKGRRVAWLVVGCVLLLVAVFLARRSAERDEPFDRLGPGRVGASARNLSPAEGRGRVSEHNRVDGSIAGRVGGRAAELEVQGGAPMGAERALNFRELVQAGRIDDNAMHEFIANLSASEVRALLPLVDDGAATGSSRRSLRAQLVERWAQLAPSDAAAWCAALPDGDEKPVLIRTVADQWAAQDPEAALQFGGPSREIFAQLARRDPAAAAARAQTLPSSDDRIVAVRSVANAWFQADPGGAVRWLQGLADPRERIGALNELLPEMAQTAPAMVGDFLTHAPDPNAVAELGGRLGTQWADSDPEAASRWAGTLPEGSELRRTAVAAVANAWRRRDRAAAGAWLNTLAPGDRPDEER